MVQPSDREILRLLLAGLTASPTHPRPPPLKSLPLPLEPTYLKSTEAL